LGEESEAVGLVDAEVVLGIVEGGSGKGHDDQSGSLIRWV
jgi:hypothetical protein